MVDSLKRAAMSFKDKITKTDLERKLIEATDNNNWGVSSTILQEIADKTSHPEDCATIMRYVWKSLKSEAVEWRRIYKSLSLIEHLLKFGSSRCVQEIKDETFKIRLLQDFSYNEEGIERGQGIRDKSRFLNTLLSDLSRLEEERELARRNKNKFVGISSDSYGSHSGGSMAGFGRDEYTHKKYESQTSDRYDPYVPKRTEEKPITRNEPPRTHTEETGATAQNIFNAPQITTKSQNQNLFTTSDTLQSGNVRKLQAPPASNLSHTSTINTTTKVPEFISFGTTAPQPTQTPSFIQAPQPPKPAPTQNDLEGIFFSSPSVSFPGVNAAPAPVPVPQAQPRPSPVVPQYPPQQVPQYPPQQVPQYPPQQVPQYPPQQVPQYPPQQVPQYPSPVVPQYPPYGVPSGMPSYGAAPTIPQYGAPQYINPGVPSYTNPSPSGNMGQGPPFALNYKWQTVPASQVMPGLSNLGMQPPSPQSVKSSNVKISHNMQGISEPSLSAMQSSPSLLQEFTHFQEAPKSQTSSKEIEASIVNLDKLTSNPKKDQPHWSSHYHY